MLKPVLTGFEALLSLFYPRICGGCNAHLRKYEGDLCLICLYSLPKTYYWDYPITPIEELFKGRLKVSSACSFLHFEKMSVTQRLMHRLKYDGKTSIGVELGRAFGLILKEKKWYSDVDIIVPVPLHFTKLARRGYNQSTTIANGLAEVYNVRVRPHALKRMVNDVVTTGSTLEAAGQALLNAGAAKLYIATLATA
jgi:predicted amidophosphoribosyltransferase